MSSVRILALAGAAAAMSTTALAADFPPALPPAPPVIQAPIVESGWYLRHGASKRRISSESINAATTRQ